MKFNCNIAGSFDKNFIKVHVSHVFVTFEHSQSHLEKPDCEVQELFILILFTQREQFLATYHIKNQM